MTPLARSIMMMLEGQTDELKPYQDRLGWLGIGALIDRYERTAGPQRDEFIQAVGEVIGEPQASPAVLAQIVHFAYSLDVTQVEPQIRQLQERPVGQQEPVRRAIQSYLTFREFVSRSPSA